jgi:hypothetical protein
VRFTSIFTFLGFRDYITTTILIDVLTFIGVWKLYEVFADIYPRYSRNLALAVMFVPSVAFWGSGILKDNYTLSAACWLTYNFYMIFIKKKKIRMNVLLSMINLYLLISLKPYIIIALFPGIIIWATLSRIKRIQNKAFRAFISPALIILGLLIGFISLSLFGENLGKYSSLDAIAKTAVITQQDLTRGEAYGQNYYDIGKFDPTLSGMLKKAPVSIGTALFRPFLWEARNPAMLMSGIENTFILIIFIYIVIKVGPFKTFKIVQQEPLLLFSLLFAVIFAFSVGLTSANFGALVRYRIPCMIFLIPFLVILNEKRREQKSHI